MDVWPGIGWSVVSARASAMAAAALGMVGLGAVSGCSGAFWEVLDVTETGADSEVVAGLEAVADSGGVAEATDGADI